MIKAVDILPSGTQLAKSHGDNLGLEYLWHKDEHSSLENSFEAIKKNAKYRRQQEVLAWVHVVERPITVHFESQTKALYLKRFTDCAGIDILYYPEESDDKEKLIKVGHYVLLRRSTLLSQPENEKVYSLRDYVAVYSETTDWFRYVMSEINNASKEVKVRFMKKSGQYILFSKKLESGSKSQQYFTDAPHHTCAIHWQSHALHVLLWYHRY